jgi:hypothetical protein
MLIPIKVNDQSIIIKLLIGDNVFIRYKNNNWVAMINDSIIIGKLASKTTKKMVDKFKEKDNGYQIWAIFKKSIIIEKDCCKPKKYVL